MPPRTDKQPHQAHLEGDLKIILNLKTLGGFKLKKSAKKLMTDSEGCSSQSSLPWLLSSTTTASFKAAVVRLQQKLSQHFSFL